jgi:peptide/nickel transport system permease protein
MLRGVSKRAGHLVIVLILVSFLSFSAVNLLPGSIATAVAGQNASAKQISAVVKSLGLDRPMLARYWDWLVNALHGTLGESFLTHESVSTTLAQRIPVTLELTVVSTILALAIAIPLALYSARRPGGLLDRGSMVVGFGMASIPSFVIALLLIVVLAGGVSSLLPTTGYVGLFSDPIGNLKTIAMPCLSLGLPEAAVYRQVLRSDLVSTLGENFILMAKSKGLSPTKILFRHALRPSSFSLLTLSGISVGRLLGGAVIIETIFAIPGVGQMLVQSVFQRDYLMMQGALLFISVAFVVVNAAVDIAYALIDPRVRRNA